MDSKDFNIWLMNHIQDEDLVPSVPLLYIQTFDEEPEQIAILRIVFSLCGILDICGSDLVK